MNTCIEMDDETRWRVVFHIADDMGCDWETAAHELWCFEAIDSSEGQVLH